MRSTTSLAFRRIPTAAGVALTLAVLALGWASPADARCEWIGNINGKPVYLIWGGECSALDPPNDNVATVTITYTGPPQPGVFTDVELYAPFDTYTTDGSTYLTVTATGAPMPLPCPTCFVHAFAHATSVPLDPTAGAESPFQFAEFNANGDSCAGTVVAAGAAEIPAMGSLPSAVLTGMVLLVGVLAALRAGSGEIG